MSVVSWWKRTVLARWRLPSTVLEFWGLCLIPLATHAVDSKSVPVHIPVIFNGEAESVRSSLCLKVVEHRLPPTDWWREAIDVDAANVAFSKVVGAMQRRDTEALRSLSNIDAEPQSDFDLQAVAFFDQLSGLGLRAVPRRYDMGNLVVYLLELGDEGRRRIAPLVFSHSNDGRWVFLPKRSSRLDYVFFDEWLRSKWGPAATDNPSFCAEDIVRNAKFSVSLGAAGTDMDVGQRGDSAEVLLDGAPIDSSNAKAKPLAALVKILDDASRQQSVDSVMPQLSREGASQLRDWFGTADALERTQYFSSIRGLVPVFVFDAYPLVVGYVRDAAGHVRVLYLIAGQDGVFRWTNAFHVTSIDKLFKKGPLYDAAPSFDAFVIKPGKSVSNAK